MGKSLGTVMKKIFFFITLLAFIVLPPAVSAHELKTDGNIGAVLHVDPEDDPIAGEPSSFYFEFKDLKKQFDSKKCNCVITVSQDGKVIHSQKLFQDIHKPSLTNASFVFTFPKKDVYQVIVKGVPTAKSFQPFTLSYDIHVTENNKTRDAKKIIHLL